VSGTQPPAGGAPGIWSSRWSACGLSKRRSSRLPPFIKGVTRHTPSSSCVLPRSAEKPIKAKTLGCLHAPSTWTSWRNSAWPCMLSLFSLFTATNMVSLPSPASRSGATLYTFPNPPPPMWYAAENLSVAAASSPWKKMATDARPLAADACSALPFAASPASASICRACALRCSVYQHV